ncbi:hypothetical protein PSPO01_06217 [Paraphaeosphaeria sporulosa]
MRPGAHPVAAARVYCTVCETSCCCASATEPLLRRLMSPHRASGNPRISLYAVLGLSRHKNARGLQLDAGRFEVARAVDWRQEPSSSLNWPAEAVRIVSESGCRCQPHKTGLAREGSETIVNDDPFWAHCVHRVGSAVLALSLSVLLTVWRRPAPQQQRQRSATTSPEVQPIFARRPAEMPSRARMGAELVVDVGAGGVGAMIGTGIDEPRETRKRPGSAGSAPGGHSWRRSPPAGVTGHDRREREQAGSAPPSAA